MGEPVAPAMARREAVVRLARAAGVAPVVLGLLEGRVAALPKGEDTDLAVLHGALVLEHEAIALYEEGLRRQLFPAGLRDYALEFRGDHLGHRDTQVALFEERGGRPPGPRPRYDRRLLSAGDAVLRAALEIEEVAQRAYTVLISQIRSRDYLLSAGFILVDEVRHMTVWRRVLGRKIY